MSCEPPEEDTVPLSYRRRAPGSTVKASAASASGPAADAAAAPGPAALSSATGPGAVEDTATLTPDRDEERTVAQGVADLERSENDAELLVLAQVDPTARNRLRDVLIAYAMQVIRSWISSGRMWKEAAKIGVPAPLPGPPPLEPEEIDSLAAEVVVRAYRRFVRNGLHKWSPLGGTSLRAWFIEDCKHQFANAIRAWSKDRGALTPGQDCSLGVDDMDIDSNDLRPAFGYDNPITPETAVVESMELDRRLRQIESNLGSRARWIFEQHSLHKRSFAEISRESGMSVYMVKKLFKRGQEILRRLWGEE